MWPEALRRVRRLRSLFARAAPWAICALCLGGVALFLSVVGDHYPVRKWLFWVYGEIWMLTLFCGAGCLATGDLVLERVFGYRAPLRERLVMGFAVGVLAFMVGVFVVGLFGGLGAVFFFLWPAVMIALGAPRLVRTLRRIARRLGAASRVVALGTPPRPLAVSLQWATLLFGAAGCALLYVNILTPGNVAFDSRWYHLAIAEHYAAGGAITRFPEGWFNGTYPHLASHLYAWAFLYPNSTLFQRIELAAHLEFLIFLATLGGVAVLARWCLGEARLRFAWAAMFLFPGLMLYDSSLSVASDHFLALWAPPVFLAFRRAFRRFDVPSALVLGACLAAAIMTKYQAVYFIPVPAIALGAKAIALVWRGRRGGAGPNPGSGSGSALLPVAKTLGAGVAAALLFSAPLWLKNWIWYGDPVYPMLPNVFSANPYVPGTNPDKFLQIPMWTPQGTLAQRLGQTIAATFTFSFVPHDWSNLHGVVPVFGSLFTLTVPLLVFLRSGSPRRRVAGLAAAAWVGLAVWYWTYHQDRYLQALLPWMAAVVAAILVMAWRAGWPARAGIAVLVAAQVIWGGDVYTFPTHAMLGQQPAKVVLDLVSSGFRRDWTSRTQSHQDMELIAPHLPRGSKVLVHERLIHLGLGAMSVADAPGTQGGISYTALQSPRAVHDLMRRFGVTHLVWVPGSTQGWQTLADDLVFFEYAERYTTNRVAIGGFALATPSPQPPAPSPPGPRWVGFLGCGAGPDSLVRLEEIDGYIAAGVPPRTLPPPNATAAFLVTRPGCIPPPATTPGFTQIATRSGYGLWIR